MLIEPGILLLTGSITKYPTFTEELLDFLLQLGQM